MTRIRVVGLATRDLEGVDIGRGLNVEGRLVVVGERDSVVVAGAEVGVVRSEQASLDCFQHHQAYHHAQGIVEYVGAEVPNTRVRVQMFRKRHRYGDVDPMCQQLRHPLFRGVHEPYPPRSLGTLPGSLVDKHAERKNPQDDLDEDAGEADQLAGLDGVGRL